jgi:hypothetical protein
LFNVNKVDAEKFIYAFTGMQLSEYAELLIKEFRIETENAIKKVYPNDINQVDKTVIMEHVLSNDKEMLYTVTEAAKL